MQGIRVPRGSADLDRRYLLAGLVRCGICGRRLDSCWADNRAAYRCRHGHTSATTPDPGRPKNLYIREDRLLPRLPTLRILLAGAEPAGGQRRWRTRRGTDVSLPPSEAELISYLCAREITLTYDPQSDNSAGRRSWSGGSHRRFALADS